MAGKLWLLEIAAPVSETDGVQGLLALSAPYGWEEKELGDGRALFLVYGEDRTELEKIANLAHERLGTTETKISEVEKKDWQSAWRQYFTPVEAGSRFVVLPPWLAHLEHTTRQRIIINPGNAFGTGHHASTVLCLVALSELLDQKRIKKRDWFLDLGCGSGILGIAACKAGLSGTGIDIDPVAIANSRENRELNEAVDLELLKGGLEKLGNEKYGLIMANILARPLIELAPRIVGALKKDGCLILGGILDTQAYTVAQAYMDCGLDAPRELADGEWRALVWE